MSTIKANDLQSATGGIPTVKGQKLIPTAWVNFNGTGTVAIRDSENVSSITDNGTGNYTANFAVAMANSNYSYSLSGKGEWHSHMAYGSQVSGIQVRRVDNSNYTNYDAEIYTVVILGGQA